MFVNSRMKYRPFFGLKCQFVKNHMMNMHVNMIFAGHSDRLYMPTFHKDINDINVGRYRGIILVDEDKEKGELT